MTSSAAPVDVLGKLALAMLFGVPILMIVTPGGFRLPMPLGIPLGVLLAWLSKAWLRREQVTATVLVGSLLVLPFAIVLLGFARDWGIGVLALLLLWPVAGLVGGFYLVGARKRRRLSNE